MEKSRRFSSKRSRMGIPFVDYQMVNSCKQNEIVLLSLFSVKMEFRMKIQKSILRLKDPTDWLSGIILQTRL